MRVHGCGWRLVVVSEARHGGDGGGGGGGEKKGEIGVAFDNTK